MQNLSRYIQLAMQLFLMIFLHGAILNEQKKLTLN